MPNPRLIKLAKGWMNPEKPKERTPNANGGGLPPSDPPPDIPADSSFILCYNDFGKEIIVKSNETYKETKAEIDVSGFDDNQEVPNMYILKRLALITTIAKNPTLQRYNFVPITPLQSEQLFKAGKLPEPSRYWEDLGLILYGTTGANTKEAAALKESLKTHRSELGLSNGDLEKRLLVVNAGIEKADGYAHGVKPIVLPGITKAYACAVLNKTENKSFEHGLDQGLPNVANLGKGTRTLYMPTENDIGLRVLYRYRGSFLFARLDVLVNSYAYGRVNFCRKAAR